MDDAGWPNLAQAVRKRRLEMGLSVPAILERIPGAMARNTWEAMEKGTRKISDTKWAQVEQALDWAAGSIQRVIDGQGPIATVTYHRDPSRPSVTAPFGSELDEALAFNTPPGTQASPAVADAIARALDARVATSPGAQLVAEVARIKLLPISADEKIQLTKAVIDLFEERIREVADAASRGSPSGGE
ncbi:hypothetical protein GCM10009557_14980 [Virgisporangium ochraceum]|uniref:Uncharacterized protein n=1 Tax=Virgisporangium ochraceum TaxID=65505 RepID=A0A8J4E9G0_9ACTN|nr:hypothetical protein [Virgisporangium ochraceum]GIJ66283.1 hypothetical protein Voc01_012000 [Virgisporangium ochraceum]